MIGRNVGQVTTQGQILSGLFSKSSYEVTAVSSQPNRFRRGFDIALFLARHSSRFDIFILDIFGGRSFVVEDVASFLIRRAGKPVVMVLRGGAFGEFSARFPTWTRRVLKRAAVLIAPSKFLARTVEPFGFSTSVIPNVVDISSYPFRRRENAKPRFFWMRSFHPAYNPLLAVRVFARVQKQYPEGTLTMAGQDKGLLEEAKKEAERLGVLGQIRFPGFLDLAGKLREAENADIVLNTNDVDNMPVALIEAAALGMPIVSTDVGGIPDMLEHGRTGLLVRNKDEIAMCEAIDKLLTDPPLTARLSENARALAEQCSWGRVKNEWEIIFSQILDRKGIH